MRPLLVLLLLAVASACGGAGSGGGGSDGDVTLRVFAAASLTDSFTELGRRFEKDHPGTEVQLNFGPSSGLAEQIGSGAPADVFASASPDTMDAVVRAGDARDPQPFATNSMQVVVPAGNPAGIGSLADLGRSGVKVALCQPQVPCGAVAAEALARAGVRVRPVTEEADVRAVLTKVSLGEVDAGVVYVTDVLSAGAKVRGIAIPADQNASTTYPIAALTGSGHATLARQFVDLVLSADGRRVLDDAGFRAP